MKKIFITIILLALAGGAIYYQKLEKNTALTTAETLEAQQYAAPTQTEITDRVEHILISDGSTYGKLLKEAGIDYSVGTDIYDAAIGLYDLAKIRVGRVIELTYDKDGDPLKKLSYKIDSEDELHVELVIAEATTTSETTASSSPKAAIWQAEIKPIPYEIKTVTKGGTVESSMYQAALDNNIDERAIIELANAFQWTIDFAMDPRVGDTFKFIYEERYLDGEYIMPGGILAGRYVNAGEQYDVFYFEENEDNIGYFDIDGNSVQKIFLKAPVAFRYISSGYTTGARYLAAFKRYTSSHMAIDYAAKTGTPVRAVGNGTITSAGWNSSGYGNRIDVHHNGTYTTTYSHLSKIYVRRGEKVSQGDIIGAVGSTGFSTGPHLHYEMIKNGSKVSPLREILPPGKPIKEENRERFFEEINKMKEQLSN